MNRRDYWLTEDIVVKVITKKLGEKYYKKKAVVKVNNTEYIVPCIQSLNDYAHIHVLCGEVS